MVEKHSHDWEGVDPIDLSHTGAFYHIARAVCRACGSELLILRDSENQQFHLAVAPPCPAKK